jgi:hypothetical protein
VSLDIAVELISEQGVHHRSIFHTPNEDHLWRRDVSEQREDRDKEMSVRKKGKEEGCTFRSFLPAADW